MRLVFRPLAPGETDHELAWFSVSLGMFALAGAWLTLHLSWPACLFHQLTGHPCPTCGTTRAMIALFHGHIVAAWGWNPLASVLCGAVALGNIYALIVLAGGLRRLRLVQITLAEKKLLRAVAVSLIAVNWVYLLRASSLV